MPDFTTEYYWQCSSLSHVTETFPSDSKPNEYYTTTISEHGNRCGCDAFKYSKGRDSFEKTCKHVEKLLKKSCRWSQFLEGGQPVKRRDKHYCPKCGREAESRGWAV
jgi:hypothetical protein